jgi:hypothetical protein
MNQMDGEDEEETNVEFIYFSFHFYLILYGLRTYHTHFFGIFFYFVFILEYPICFAPRVIREGECVRGRNPLCIYSHFSHNLHLAVLFTIISLLKL